MKDSAFRCFPVIFSQMTEPHIFDALIPPLQKIVRQYIGLCCTDISYFQTPIIGLLARYNEIYYSVSRDERQNPIWLRLSPTQQAQQAHFGIHILHTGWVRAAHRGLEYVRESCDDEYSRRFEIAKNVCKVKSGKEENSLLTCFTSPSKRILQTFMTRDKDLIVSNTPDLGKGQQEFWIHREGETRFLFTTPHRLYWTEWAICSGYMFSFSSLRSVIDIVALRKPEEKIEYRIDSKLSSESCYVISANSKIYIATGNRLYTFMFCC